MKCSKRLAHKQYFQVSSLCGSLIIFICQNMSHDFTELCMEMQCWRPSKGQQYGSLKSTRTSSGTQLAMKVLSFCS